MSAPVPDIAIRAAVADEHLALLIKRLVADGRSIDADAVEFEALKALFLALVTENRLTVAGYNLRYRRRMAKLMAPRTKRSRTPPPPDEEWQRALIVLRQMVLDCCKDSLLTPDEARLRLLEAKTAIIDQADKELRAKPRPIVLARL